MNYSRPLALALALTVGNSCSTASRDDDFETLDAPSSGYIYSPTIPLKSKRRNPASRRPSSVVKNIFEAFAHQLEVLVVRVNGSGVRGMTRAEIERIVANEASGHISGIRRVSNTTELYDEIKNLKNAEKVQIEALEAAMDRISARIGVNKKAVLVAFKQAQAEAAMKVADQAHGLPIFDRRKTREMENSITKKIQEKLTGRTHSGIITGDPYDLTVVKDINGNSMTVETQSLFTKEMDLAAYDNVIQINSAQTKMDPQTFKDFKNWLSKYDVNNHTQYSLHPDETMTMDLFTRVKLVNAFNSFQMLNAKRVAILLEDAHLYLGSTEKKGVFDNRVYSIVKEWLISNPSISKGGSATGKIIRHENNGRKAYFKCLIFANKTEHLAPELLRIGGVARIHNPIANKVQRLDMIKNYTNDPEYKDLLGEDLTDDIFAKRSPGIPLKTISNMFESARTTGRKIVLKDVLVMLKESLEERFGKDVLNIIIPDFPAGKMEAALRANPGVLEEVEAALKNLEVPNAGGLDAGGSKGILFSGPYGAFKTTFPEIIAHKQNTVLVTIKKTQAACHGCSSELALQLQDIMWEAEDMLFLIDEAHKMPKTMGDAGINQVIADDVTNTAAIWLETISQWPTKKTRSVLFFASSDPHLIDPALIRVGRIGIHIPLSHLVELEPRKEALRTLIEKYKNEIGDAVTLDALTDDQIKAMPTIKLEEMEQFIKTIISYKPKGVTKLKNPAFSHLFDEALENVSFPRGNFTVAQNAEINKLFFCTNPKFLPEYARKIPPFQFDQAKKAWLEYRTVPDFLEVPNWVTGYGGKSTAKQSAAKEAADAAKAEQ